MKKKRKRILRPKSKHMDEDGDIQMLNPMTLEEKLHRVNQDGDSLMRVEMMTKGEIIEKYGEFTFIPDSNEKP